MKKKEVKYYSNLSVKDKKKIRETLTNITAHRKCQLKEFEDGFINPLNDLIALEKKVLKGEIPIEHYVEQQEKYGAWLIEALSKKSE